MVLNFIYRSLNVSNLGEKKVERSMQKWYKPDKIVVGGPKPHLRRAAS